MGRHCFIVDVLLGGGTKLSPIMFLYLWEQQFYFHLVGRGRGRRDEK